MESIQGEFDSRIGRLDRILSELVEVTKRHKAVSNTIMGLDDANVQTLKHHAEDMILAGTKILKDLDEKKSLAKMMVHIRGSLDG